VVQSLLFMRRQIHTTYDNLLKTARPAKQAILVITFLIFAPSLRTYASCIAPVCDCYSQSIKLLLLWIHQQEQTASSTYHDSDTNGQTASPYTSPSMQLDIAQGQQLPNVAACATISAAADGPTVRQRRTAQRVHCFLPACLHVHLFIWEYV
jgi:hypothetical protein